MEASRNLSWQIVRLLQEIIIRGAEQIYEIQRNRAPHWNRHYPYNGPILTFSDKGELLEVEFHVDPGKSPSPGGWNTPAVHEIKAALDDFNRNRRKLGSDPEENLQLIKKYLCPKALLILKAVDESYGFFPGRDPDFVLTANRTSELFCEDSESAIGLFGKNISLIKYYKSLGLVRAGAKDEFRGVRELEMKVEDLHLSLARMERAAAREQTAAVNNSAREPSDKPRRESSKKGFAGLEDLERNPYIEAAPLTDRQKDCAHLKWSYGLTDTQIAQRLGISRATVQEHLDAAKKKIGHSQQNAKRSRGIKSPTRD
jgi:DNA-binding CsgD family transcriptional regulator